MVHYVAGSRRPSLSSVQSSTSSIRSYSAKRWEREREQKERRQMSMRLAQLHDKMSAGREVPKHAPTPSPRSPNNSTDGLLPSVCEIREVRSSTSYPLWTFTISKHTHLLTLPFKTQENGTIYS